jgi:tetratricopeptide (TPR) repeat protein
VLEKEEFDKAAALTDPTEKISALQKFIKTYPEADQKAHALELIVSSRAVLGDQKLQAHETEAGIALFKLAVNEAPVPVPDKLFQGILSNLPANLFWQGQREAAVEIAKLIEEKTSGNARQLLSLAAFYIGTENAAEAKRLAEKMILLEPNLPDAYQTLGLANRMSFQLQESADAYVKALELKPDSAISKRSLAEMKRALGKPEEAAALYREILAVSPDDSVAKTGLILCLFDAENKAEAESEMAKSLEQDPNNLPLIAGAAYWYAAHEQGAKAIEMAQKAIAIEPRYIWSHIALARGYMSQKKPLDAERVLLSSRQYGNFPTLEYEIASARLMAGFYREAVEELQKSFDIKEGMVRAQLGGRILRESKSFIELISFERRASIFEPLAADNPENAARLRALLDLHQKIAADEPNEAETGAAADEFIKGDDRMKFHRQIYAAGLLAQKRVASSKVLEIMKAATGNSDPALEGPNATSATLADQLYESRAISMARNQLVLVPEVPRQTLSAILRGKIEDITGWALLQQGNKAEAIIRLRRAVGVLPDKSAWWRSSVWKLGAALEADGNDKEALDNYIKSYTTDRPDGIKYLTIETVYRRIYGNSDGLEAKIGPNPSPVVVQKDPPPAEAIVTKTDNPETKAAPEAKPEIKTDPSPESAPEIKPESTPAAPSNADATPSPSPGAATITESTQKPSPEIRTGETPAEKPAVIKTGAETSAPQQELSKDTPKKDLFDPVIITIPKPEGEKPVDAAAKPAVEAEDQPEAKKPEDAGAGRPRVVAEKETPKCSITFSQENVSLLNNGGGIGILVGIEGEGDIKELKAVSSSPADVTALLDPGIGGRRAFYLIKSISTKTGMFTITFETSCGRKEIGVKVN